MTQDELRELLGELRSLPKETEWVEFKVNDYYPQNIGEYISALSNAACLHDKKKGYLLFGIENKTHNLKGTRFRPRQTKIGNEELENWLARLLSPRIDFVIYEFECDSKPVVLFKIDAAGNTPVKFSGMAYIRVGTYKKKLPDYPEKERKIWVKKAGIDWSCHICDGATIDDLDSAAIAKAREKYREKFPHIAAEANDWDDITFLNKARITVQGKITRTAIILVGKNESDHFLNPSIAQITWVLKDENGLEKDYEHFGPPFLLNIDKILGKIRNLKYRHLPDGTLFPLEINQYDNWVIREALNNCIAHQDYELKGRISVIEKPDELIFANLGNFIPGTVEEVIERDSPPERYRNQFLANAMVNLKMIDTIGSGIKRMFLEQKKRFFPLPDYDLSNNEKVLVRLQGKILDKNYTQLLIEHKDLSLPTVMLLDKVQKGLRLSKDEHRFLKSKGLVEGQFPNIFVSRHIAAVTGEQAKYIKNRGFDKKYYKAMIIDFIKEFGSASRKDIDNLLLNKLPEVLNGEQKRNKINNLIFELSRKDQVIRNQGSDKKPCWVLV